MKDAHRQITHIGGVSYAINGGGRILSLDPARHWPDFWSVRQKQSADVEVNIEWLPRLEPLSTLLFDTGVGWRLGRRGDRRIFELTERAGDVFAQLELDRPVTRSVLRYRLRPGLVSEPTPNPFAYPLDQMISMYALAPRCGVALHAAGVVLGGRCLVFPGKSGAGKTTLSRLLERHHDAKILSDERIIVRKHNDVWWAYGTPWPGEGGMAHCDRAPISHIYVITKAQDHSIAPCTSRMLFEALLPVASVPWFDQEVQIPTLHTLHGLAHEVVGGILSFAPSDDVVEVLRAVA